MDHARNPSPNPVASQARPELVPPFETFAPRIGVPCREREGRRATLQERRRLGRRPGSLVLRRKDQRPGLDPRLVDAVQQIYQINDGTSPTDMTAVAPSPTAVATRLPEPSRTSPAANTPGMLVSMR